MKKIILLIIISCFNLQAQPTGIISSLMDAPVSKFTYGMDECNNYLDREDYAISKAFENIAPSQKYGLIFSSCDYDYYDNEIKLRFFIGERSKIGGFIPKTDFKNDECKQMMEILINTFLRKYTQSGEEKIINNITAKFKSKYISTNLDKEIDLILNDYISIYISEIGNDRCKQKLDFDEPVLFFQ